MHVAFWVSAGILLTGAVVAAVFVHKGVPDVVSETPTAAGEAAAVAGAADGSGASAGSPAAHKPAAAGSPVRS